MWVHFVTDRRKLLPTSRLVTAVQFILVDFFQDAIWKKYLLDTFPRSCTCSVCVCGSTLKKIAFCNDLPYNISPLNWVLIGKVLHDSPGAQSPSLSSQSRYSMGSSCLTFPMLLPRTFFIWSGQLGKRSVHSPCMCSLGCLSQQSCHNRVSAVWV